MRWPSTSKLSITVEIREVAEAKLKMAARYIYYRPMLLAKVYALGPNERLNVHLVYSIHLQ